MDLDDQNGSFVPPPEAPVFRPTAAEFIDPMDYISKIRPTIEKSGLCKIIPPQEWQPPFAVNVESFKFVPRVQKINELEATTRVKLIFLHKLWKFWELQGVVLKAPTVNRKPLDIHKLHKIVQEEGGYDLVTSEDKWKHVAFTRMNLPRNANKSYSTIIKSHYEKILLPYDMCGSGTTSDHLTQVGASMKNTGKLPEKEDVDYSANSEMKKLQFFGAGKKVALPSIQQAEDVKREVADELAARPSPAPRRVMRDRSRASYLESDICRICSLTDKEEDMLTCSNCDEVYHRYCLVPRVSNIIKGDWRCPRCVAKEYTKPTEVFGFEQSNTPYTLAEFGIMADKFKQDYFNKTRERVTYDEVEKEFWRLTQSINENVTVLYGADVHALTNGSGFPTQPNEDLSAEDEKYIQCRWNLNNLQNNDRSVLKYVSGDVSGMKVPWCYVGMCFSTFCWHIEDHWSYSINYNHWGEAKTWYGVPSCYADELEMVMKSRAPELFEQSPDLLHHITTMMNPNSLMAHKIPVVRTNQRAGEFIVTGPRAFHAGFNQGYNFAEAVNFCPADWLPMGRACVNNYKLVKRYCVFSHEELVCKMAADADNLDLTVAVETHKELLAIVDQERKRRRQLMADGVKNAEREAFEVLPDDGRQCSHCKTTCFLSALTCSCKPNKLVCIEHTSHLCKCPASQKCLRYRYTLDEFPALIRNLGNRVERFQMWLHNTRSVFDTKKLKDRVSFSELKQLLVDAKEYGYPDNNLFRNLQRAVKDAEKYVCLVKEVVNRKARSRRNTDLAIRSAARRLTLGDLSKLISQLVELACNIKDSDMIEDLLERGTQFQADVKAALCVEPREREKLVKLREMGLSLDLDLPEIAELEQAVEQTKWIEDVQENLEVDEDDLITMDELKILVDRGLALPTHPEVEKLIAELEQMVKVSQSWEEKASICLQAHPKHTLSTIEAILAESEDVKVYMPNIETLRESVKKSQYWRAKAEEALNPTAIHPTLDHLGSLITKAKTLPIKLDQIDSINNIIKKAEEWKCEAYNHFVKKDSADTLLDLLLPRHTSRPTTPRKKQQTRKSNKQKDKDLEGKSAIADKLLDSKFATEGMYEKSSLQEIQSMTELRLTNQSASAPRLCTCERNPSQSMFQCDLCQAWFHYSCCNLSKNSRSMKMFFCLSCARSKRPSLDVILSLLVSLQKIPARFVEGEALQYLTERTIEWQQKAESFITSQQEYSQLKNKFDVIKAKNEYWKGKELEQAEFERVLADEHVLSDHDYLSPSRAQLKQDHPVFEIPEVEPSEEFCAKLDSLLLEGHLLEVSVAECEKLHSFDRVLHEYKLNKLQPPLPPPRLQRLHSKHPRKPVLSSRDENIKTTVKGKSKDESGRGSNKSDSKNKPTQEAVISSTTSSGSKKPSRVQKRNCQQGGAGQKKKKRIVIEITEEEEWGEYDENCAAVDGCLLPDEESIGWVQCEGCKLWFHFACIGLTPNSLADADYYCAVCKHHGDGDLSLLAEEENDAKSTTSLEFDEAEEAASPSGDSRISDDESHDDILVFPSLSLDNMSSQLAS